VVVLCFAVSWVEALFILPSHLAHIDKKPANKLGKMLNRAQQTCSQGLNQFIRHYYFPLLKKCLRWPSLTLA
jgi:multidrug efflux pump subunit AcrB